MSLELLFCDTVSRPEYVQPKQRVSASIKFTKVKIAFTNIKRLYI